MIYIIIVFNIVSIVYLLIRSIDDFGKLNYFLIFAIFNFLYGVAIPLEIVIFQKEFAIQGHLVSVNQMELILFLSTMSNYGFYIGLLLSNKKDQFNLSLKSDSSYPISIFMILGLLLFVLFVFYKDALFQSFRSYSDNFTITYNNSSYAYIKEVLYAVLAIVSLIFLQKKSKLRLISIALTVVLIIFGILSKDKNPILMASIPWFWVSLSYLYEKLISRKWLILLIFVLGIAVIPVFNGVYGSYRGKWDKDVINYYSTNGVFGTFESKEILISLVDVTNSEDRLYGQTYLSGFVNWIPKSLWAYRPESLAESYAKFRIKGWAPGMGLGFSLLAESYLNFDVYGAFIQFLIIGLLFGFIRRFMQQVFAGNEKYAEFLFFVWAFNELVLMHRGQFNMPSSFLRFLIPLFIFYIVFDKIKILTIIRKWGMQILK